LPQGTLTLDTDAAQSIAAQANGARVSLSLKQLALSDLTYAGRRMVGRNATVFDVSVMSGKQQIGEFDGIITVTAPYRGALPANIWYLNSAGELTQAQAEYDPETGTIIFAIHHHLRSEENE
jgi:hypothetical protein